MEKAIANATAYLPGLRSERSKLKELTVAMVGTAVFCAQLFEGAFAPIYVLHRHYVETANPASDDDLLDPSYKTPLMNYVRQLEANGHIDAAFSQRLKDYITARNKLVHSWVREEGFPDTEDFSGLSNLARHASYLAEEAIALAKLLVDYVTSQSHDKSIDIRGYQTRMQELFRQAPAIARSQEQS